MIYYLKLHNFHIFNIIINKYKNHKKIKINDVFDFLDWKAINILNDCYLCFVYDTANNYYTISYTISPEKTNLKLCQEISLKDFISKIESMPNDN